MSDGTETMYPAALAICSSVHWLILLLATGNICDKLHNLDDVLPGGKALTCHPDRFPMFAVWGISTVRSQSSLACTGNNITAAQVQVVSRVAHLTCSISNLQGDV
jgi:hypothetical protein